MIIGYLGCILLGAAAWHAFDFTTGCLVWLGFTFFLAAIGAGFTTARNNLMVIFTALKDTK